MTRRTGSPRRTLVVSILIPLLAFLSLGAWSLSSPVGASPDDDFHLASIWCGLGDRDGLCENRDDDAVERYVPTPVTTATCYAYNNGASADCWNGEAQGLSKVQRANVDRLYPPLFYGAMSVFASPNVAASVLVMKLVNSALVVGVLAGAFFALPRRLRPALLISVIVTAVPLGMFVYGSTNPSSWALLSAAVVWITLYGALQTDGRRRWILAGLAVLGTVLGAGARADSAVYAVFGVGMALVLGLRWKRPPLVPTVTAAVIVVLSVAFYLSAWQGSSIVGGIDSDRPPLSGSQHLSNLLSAPTLWAGAQGGWGLGWLDTPMPAVVMVLAGAVFWGAFFVGGGRASVRRGVAIALGVAAMWLVPVVLLGQSRMLVGELIQPRYLLPLMIVTIGVASARLDIARAWAGFRAWAVVAALALANVVALHTNIQRYTTGLDRFTADPGADAEWWWAWMPSPLFVWVGGGLAFAAVLALLALRLPAESAADETPIRVSAATDAESATTR
ncbi:DUF2142 domain-containing protein [Microbacterium sp. RD1]|uniref:DUF2142 domain-containing protein n=1 Tax=Microbacterium sp. RD1 TaxID=3457313 RepID=UPI003FA55F7C